MPRATADAAGGGGGAAATAASGSGMESNIKAAAHVPLAVFSKSSSLMSDRASQAMEKALRHAPPAAPPSEDNIVNPADTTYQGPEAEKASITDHRYSGENFADRDPAHLFSAPALINDKDGSMIHQDMSPQTRGATGNIPQEVSHSAGEMFSDGEDAEVSLRTTRSVEVSQPSGPERSEASDTELEGKRTIMLENCAKEDLDLVKAALLHLLREDEDQSKVDVCDISELDKHLEESEGSRLSAGDIDLQLLSRLLDQVQTLREQKQQHRQRARTPRSSRQDGRSSWDIIKRPGGKEKRVRTEDLRKTVEAATQAAKSAAEAARAAAASVSRNSDVVEKLLLTLIPSSNAIPMEKQGSSGNDFMEDEESSDSEDVKTTAKKIVAQNRITHVVLGLMLVSSFVWRYVVVKVVKRVKSKVTDPWGYVGGMLTDGFKSPGKEKDVPADDTSQGPQFKIPPLLRGEQETEEIQAAVSKGSKGSKEEQSALNFGNILQIKPDRSS